MADKKKLPPSTAGLPDPTLQEVLEFISGLTPTLIEVRSGVRQKTIRNWRSGKTRSPQNKTMEFALRAAGFKRVIVPRGD
jgi:hypothetical protein